MVCVRDSLSVSFSLILWQQFLALCRLEITSLNNYSQDVRRHQNHNLLLYIFFQTLLYLSFSGLCVRADNSQNIYFAVSFFICFGPKHYYSTLYFESQSEERFTSGAHDFFVSLAVPL